MIHPVELHFRLTFCPLLAFDAAGSFGIEKAWLYAPLISFFLSSS
jgi:hypothetical protein